MKNWVNVGSMVGKDVLNLDNGTFVGKAQNILVNSASQSVAGVLLRQKGLLGSKNMVALEDIKAFGSHTITLSNMSAAPSSEGVSIINMPVVTIDGTVLGKIIDFAFDPASGLIGEYVLSGGLLKDQPFGKGVLRGEQVSAIGHEVVIAQEKITLDDLYPPEEETYQSWQEIDELMDDLQSTPDEELDDVLEDFTEKINETIDEVESKLQNVNVDDFSEKLKGQAEKFTADAMELFGSLRDKLKENKIDADSLKEDLKAKFASKNSAEDSETILIGQIEEQLKGSTVQKPVIDAGGNVIIWPGQLIGQEEIKQAISAGKLQDLINLTVPLEDDVIVQKAAAEEEATSPENLDE